MNFTKTVNSFLQIVQHKPKGTIQKWPINTISSFKFLAVFVPGYTLENTLATLYILYGCFPRVRRQVTIHLVHPISALLKETDLMFLIIKSQEIYAKCSKALEVIRNVNKNVAKNYDKEVMTERSNVS